VRLDMHTSRRRTYHAPLVEAAKWGYAMAGRVFEDPRR